MTTIDHVERLRGILSPRDMDAADQLAKSLGDTLENCPYLLRALEDVAIIQLFADFLSAGEGYRNAITRTAKEVGLSYSNTRYRIESKGLDITK